MGGWFGLEGLEFGSSYRLKIVVVVCAELQRWTLVRQLDLLFWLFVVQHVLSNSLVPSNLVGNGGMDLYSGPYIIPHTPWPITHSPIPY